MPSNISSNAIYNNNDDVFAKQRGESIMSMARCETCGLSHCQHTGVTSVLRQAISIFKRATYIRSPGLVQHNW